MNTCHLRKNSPRLDPRICAARIRAKTKKCRGCQVRMERVGKIERVMKAIKGGNSAIER